MRRSSPLFQLTLAAGEWADKFVVINKPSGLSAQASRSASSVEQAVLTNRQNRPVFFPHRLDKASCGLLALAFNKSTVAALNSSLAARQWEKKYRVMVQAEEVPEPVRQVLAGRRHQLHSLETLRSSNGSLKQAGLIYSLIAPTSAVEAALGRRGGGSGGGGMNVSANFSVSVNGCAYQEIESDDAAAVVSDEHMRDMQEQLSSRLSKRLQTVPWKLAVTQFRLVAEWGAEGGASASPARSTALPPSAASGQPRLQPPPRPNTRFNSSSPRGPHLALYEARPITGRTHQLRVHFSECGLPVLGDRYYCYGGLDDSRAVAALTHAALPWAAPLDANSATGDFRGDSRDASGFRGRDERTTASHGVLQALRPFRTGDAMGLQSYHLAFPHPSATAAAATGSKPAAASRQQASASLPSSSKFDATAPTMVRGATRDAQGRVLVRAPVPADWSALLKECGSAVVHDAGTAHEWGIAAG